MQLLLDRGAAFSAGPLNVRRREKVLTVLTACALLAGVVALATMHAVWLIAMALCLSVICIGNAGLLSFFVRSRGPVFALCTIPCRLLFYFESGLGAAWAILTHDRQGKPAALRTADGHPQATTADRVQ